MFHICMQRHGYSIIQAVLYNIQLSGVAEMSALKREALDLDDLLKQANSSLNQYLQQIDAQKYIISPLTENTSNNIDAIDVGFQKMSFFQQIEDFILDSNIQSKIANLKETQFSQKRRDDFFKKHKKDQQQKIASRKKAIERTYNLRDSMPKLLRGEFVIHDKDKNKSQTFPMTPSDMEGLRPDTDLNDTIIANYIKLMQFVFLPPEVQQISHIFSSFFLQKLIPQILKDQNIGDKDNLTLVEYARDRVKQNYKNVKRWTKKIDIFGKDILVVPINAFKHWFTVFVLQPHSLLTNNSKCQIVYCDSMMEQKEFIVEAIRKYLQYELEQKKGIKTQLNSLNLPSYQLMLPRQTNTHDCGLYMLSYIEELLMNAKELENLSQIKNRRKLNLFPRTLILTMRERLRSLFTRLINAKDDDEKNQVLAEYKGHRQTIIRECDINDFDTINEREYRKYEKIQLPAISGLNQQQRKFTCEIKFYLDPDVNYYEKDK